VLVTLGLLALVLDAYEMTFVVTIVMPPSSCVPERG
jgi:hypothetical protein